MRLLTVHADYLEVFVKQKAIDEAEDIKEKEQKFDECLVVFTSVEEGDGKKVVERAKKEILNIAEQVNASRIVLYPLVHLTSKPAQPAKALNLLKELAQLLSTEIETHRVPFGWYKGYVLKCKGHPLSELSREIKEEKAEDQEEEISESLKREEKIVSEFYIFTPDGELIEKDKFDYTGYENLKKFMIYETKKARAYASEPVHIALMKKHELIAYEPGSDPGNFRYLPKGVIIKRILERMVSKICIDDGAMEIETPLMYDFNHPALKKYLNRFPARQYIVLSDDKRLFLRFAACFGQFLAMHDMVISHKHLPLKLYELTRYSFRREQRGELAGLKRLRAFTMPDMHTLCKDIEQAKKEFEHQLEMCIAWNKELGIDCEVAFRVEKTFFEQNREWYANLVKKVGKPVLFEIFNERYAYFITKFEFNFIDSKDKAAALSTVQIDVENAETYDITYVDEEGKKQRPIILHASISGGLERVIFAILEREGMRIQQGEKANWPLFLAPVQVRIIPVSQKFLPYAKDLLTKANSFKVRIDLDDEDESLGKKIRKAEKEWIPYICIIGEEEMQKGVVSVRERNTGQQRELKFEDLLNKVEKSCASYPYYPLTLPKELSKRPKMG